MIKGLHYNASVVRQVEKPCEEAARGLFVEEPSSVSCLPGGAEADPSPWRERSSLPVPHHVSIPISSVVETSMLAVSVSIGCPLLRVK